MKKLTRDRVVPIIFASVSWLIFAMTGSGSTFLAKIRQQKKGPCQALLARIEQLIDQILVNPDGARQEVREEHLGKGRFLMKDADDIGLLQLHDLAFGHGHGCSHPPGCRMEPESLSPEGKRTMQTVIASDERLMPWCKGSARKNTEVRTIFKPLPSLRRAPLHRNRLTTSQPRSSSIML
jgi:hypothetical protein